MILAEVYYKFINCPIHRKGLLVVVSAKISESI